MSPHKPSDFDVLMSIYRNEQPEHFNACMQSIVSQTCRPIKIVLVHDGPLPDSLTDAITSWKEAAGVPLESVVLEENVGLGRALQFGLTACTSPLVARMDTDDICLRDRFERQINYFLDYPETDLLGSSMQEFDSSPENIIGFRHVPLEHGRIVRRLKLRNPFNHVTTMFKRQSVLNVGGYKPFANFEDYYLWARLVAAGAIVANLREPLVLVRAGRNMVERRRGVSYARDEISFMRELLRLEILSPLSFARNVMLRLPSRLVPSFILDAVYRTLRHRKAHQSEMIPK